MPNALSFRKPSFRLRRTLSIVVTGSAIAVVAAAAWVAETRLANPAWVTGATLMAAVLSLMLLGIRRRIPVLPLGNVSTWTQIHLYTGLFAAGVYAMHVPTLIADGMFEGTLSVLFLLATASGVYGIFASRTIPKRLNATEAQPRFDQLAWHREQIATAAADWGRSLTEPASIAVLEDFYGAALRPFFMGPPPRSYLIAPRGTRRQRLLAGLGELDRYLDGDGRDAAGRLAALVRRRDDLDYQYAMQLRLRVWVVFHAVLSVLVLLGSVLHVALVWRFHAT